jgi:Fur family peroxide stress response transcriptional regulator
MYNNVDNSKQKQMARFEQICRAAGERITPQRIEIFKSLISDNEHPSAEVLWRSIRLYHPCISLNTVNRTLLMFCRIGAAFIVEGSGDVKRYDGGGKNHQHLRCVKCRKIIDFHYEPYDEQFSVPTHLTGKFKVLRTAVYVEGICEDCQDILRMLGDPTVDLPEKEF